jgi:hypothetical protein
MSSGFEPSEYCVICGRGKQSYRHAGNRRFRLAITMYMDRYEQAKTKLDKSLIVVGLVDAIRSYNGGFVKRNTKQQGQWIDIGDILAVSIPYKKSLLLWLVAISLTRLCVLRFLSREKKWATHSETLLPQEKLAMVPRLTRKSLVR